MLQYPCVHINLQNINKFVIEIFKHNRYGKLNVEEDPRIEGCVKQKIQDKDNLTPNTLPVYYAYMLLPITNHM